MQHNMLKMKIIFIKGLFNIQGVPTFKTVLWYKYYYYHTLYNKEKHKQRIV